MVLNECYAKGSVESVFLNVMGGLCSRLRAVLAAADFCERLGVEKLIISWPRAEPNLKEFGGFSQHLQWLWELPPNWIAGDMGVNKFPKSLYPEHQASQADLKIRTCHPEDFEPESVAALMTQLDRMTPRFEPQDFGDCIGVNVRWSLRETMDVATPEWYAQRVREIVRETGIRRVKLVTDSGEAYRRFVAGLPGLEVVENKRPFLYDGDGIAWQAQELYELASCQWFIGADRSSYSQMVRWMRGDTELDITQCNVRASRSEDRLNPAGLDFVKEVCG